MNEKKKPGQTLKRRSLPLAETITYTILLVQNLSDPLTDTRMANMLGMAYPTFMRWKPHSDWKLVRELVERQQPSRDHSFAGYVFARLSPQAKKTWEGIQFWKDHKDWAEKRDALITHCPVRVKQELYIHALVATCFDVGRSLLLTGLSRVTLDNWASKDLKFNQLLEEIRFHKKNFFEQSMIDLVKARHPLAVIWANKTINADRGYSERLRVEHTVASSSIDFDALDLDVETRRKVLEAIRRQQERLNGGNGSSPRLIKDAPVMEAEVVA